MDLEQRIAQLSPTKLALLERKLKKSRPVSPPQSEPPAVQLQKDVPLSFSQERLWFLEQMEPDSCLYNLPTMLRLHGAIDPGLVEDSARRVVARHSALRTRFVVRDDHAYQVIADNAADALDFASVDLRGDPTDGTRVSALVNEHMWAPFNLATGPLVRVRLILLRGTEHLLLVVMHHIVSDGWSMNIFTREFRSFYEAASAGRVADLPPLAKQYVDYSVWQRHAVNGERLAALLSYWRATLEGAPSLLELPLDHPRPARQSFNGALHPFTVTRSSLQNLKSLCRECNVVPFMVMLSAFKTLLFRYTNQPRIVVGTPIANRSHSEFEPVIGFFTNTLVLCSTMNADMTFRDLLRQVRDTTLGAYEHQDLPFEKLVSELQPERNLSHNPLFQVMFTFQNLPADKTPGAGATEAAADGSSELSVDVKYSKFDLTLAMAETDGGLSAVLEYATDLFDAGTIARMATHFVNILEHLLQHPDDSIAGFSFLPADERRLIVEQWNDTAREWADVLPLHGRFERCARQMPDAPALIFRDTRLSYAELDRRANGIAALLRRRGVDRGSIVGICLPRSVEMVVGLYAILKAGAAYMPIEPDFPETRIAYMLGDANVRHVLTTRQCLTVLSPHDVDAIALDHPALDACDAELAPPVDLRPADLAYVLFTSGSTGQPKGVMVSHGAIDNRLQWMQDRYRMTPDERVMQKTPYTFDVSVWEFFWPLAVGAALVVAEPDRHKESLYLADLIGRQQVTCLHFVPSMLQLFLHEDLTGCDSLRRIICSGEAMTIDQCRRLQALRGVTGHNLYGPTEAAVDVTHWDCDEWRDQYFSVPIGRPIANTQIYILNEWLQPSPIGVPGELYIGGRNLAEGYVNKPDLTARQFIHNPFSADGHSRLYKTGDLARFRPDGNIEYIGRIDSQVKLRGLRIELGEIESVLRQFPGVSDAVVVVHRFGDHDERLAAYVVLEADDSTVDVGAVNAFIARKLPNYMVPATIMAIPEVPLSPNGKLDRKALPKPAAVRASLRSEATSDIERELLAIWRRFLKTDAVDITDDFFALGGHSILVTQVINSINRQYRLNVPVRMLFENPTVKQLAAALSECEDEAWLEESRTAATILTRSRRRLLEMIDDVTEDELDDVLAQHFGEEGETRFETVEALLAWSRRESAADHGRTGAPTLTDVRTGTVNADSAGMAYLRRCLELAQAKAGIERSLLSTSRPSAPEAMNGSQELLARLEQETTRIFESYAREVKDRLSAPLGRPLAPTDLQQYCAGIISIANLVTSLRPFVTR